MDIDRRALLIGGSAVAGGILMGTIGNRLGWWDIDLLGGSEPDAAIERVVRTGEAQLIVAYDAALQDPGGSDPGYAAQLALHRQHHVDHLSALGGGERDVDRAAVPGEVDPDDPQVPPIVPALPEDPAQWPPYFAALEQGHADITATGVRIAGDGALARLLVLVLASETGHVEEWADA
jgi:hypothetical protein